METISDFTRLENENYNAYIWRLDNLIQSGKYKNWREITPMVNKELFGDDESQYRDESAYRKACKYARDFKDAGIFNSDEEYLKELQIQKRELERKKIQFRDERNAWQKQNYTDARVEEKLNKLELELTSLGRINFDKHNDASIDSDYDMLIILSDLHICQTFDSIFGKYNTDVAKDRLNQLLKEIISIRKLHNSKKCYVSLQGDLISGNIH